MVESSCTRLNARCARCFGRHREEGRLIVFEGSPCAGKTTTVRSVTSRRGGVVIPELDHTAEAHLVAPAQIQAWYLATEIDRQFQIRVGLKRSPHVFQDRNILGTLAFSYALSKLSRSSALFPRVIRRLLNETNGILVRPDILIALYVDPAVGLERRRRLSGEPLDPIWADMTFLEHHAAFYHSVVPTFPADTVATIDTTDLTPEDTALAVDQVIEGAKIR